MKKFFSKVKDKFSVHFISSFKKEKKKKEKRKLNRREKILKYTAIVLLPTLAIASGVVLGFREFNAKKGGGTTNQVVITTNGIKRKIFLVSEDNYTVPITVTLDQRTTLQQEILDVFDLLKTSSKANSTYVSGFINDNTKITSFNLSNKVLELNLSEEFLDSKYNDVNVIEALTLTFLQFDEIDELRLMVDGQLLTSYNDVPLPSSLDYGFGINQEIANIRDIKGKEKVIVFARRNYDSNTEYLIPVSVYSEKGKSKNITFANAVKKNFTSGSLLKKVDLYKGISSEQTESDDFVLSVNSTSLSDEDYVNKDLFDLVNLSLQLMNIDQTVSFTLEGESVQVDGVYELEDYKVSSTIINEVKI